MWVVYKQYSITFQNFFSQVYTVEYIADENGFQPTLKFPEPSSDSVKCETMVAKEEKDAFQTCFRENISFYFSIIFLS